MPDACCGRRGRQTKGADRAAHVERHLIETTETTELDSTARRSLNGGLDALDQRIHRLPVVGGRHLHEKGVETDLAM